MLVLQADDPRLDGALLGLQRYKSLTEWAYITHDRDAAAPHVHIAIRCQAARSREDVSRWLGVPVTSVRVLSGVAAFPQYLKYFTHEAADQQHKAQYPIDEVTANFDWRALVDALDAPRRRITADSVALDLLTGTMTLAKVIEQHPALYEKNSPRFRRAERDGAEHRAAQQWQQEVARQAARDAEAAQELHQRQAAREVEEAAQQARDAAEQAAEAERQAEHEAKVRAEVAAEREASSATRAAEAQAQAHAQERRDLIDMIAVDQEIPGVADARERGVVALVGDDTVDALAAFYADAVGCDAAELDEEVAEHHTSLADVRHDLSVAEYHADEGDTAAFEKALRLRQTYGQWPDLYDLPTPRGGIKTAWRDQLVAADE